MSSFFAGRRAVIVTKHGKERVLYPVLRELGMAPEMLVLDTDQFGTFTPEVARAGTQHEALRAKIRAARELTPYDAVFVASEGAFFPDPDFPFVTLDVELIALYDPSSEIEIVASAVSHGSNHTSIEAYDDDALGRALMRIGLPSHAAVVRGGSQIEKGLVDEARVREIVRAMRGRGDVPIVESDMRAHVNPTRQAVIAEAAAELAQRVRSLCPRCTRPGFWPTRVIPGMESEALGEPTGTPRAFVARCSGCGYSTDSVARSASGVS